MKQRRKKSAKTPTLLKETSDSIKEKSSVKQSDEPSHQICHLMAFDASRHADNSAEQKTDNDPDYLSIINEYIDQFNKELHGSSYVSQNERDGSPSSLSGAGASSYDDIGSLLQPSWNVSPRSNDIHSLEGKSLLMPNEGISGLFLPGSAPQPTLQEQLSSHGAVNSVRASRSCHKQLLGFDKEIGWDSYVAVDSFRSRHRSDGPLLGARENWNELLPHIVNLHLNSGPGGMDPFFPKYCDLPARSTDADSAYFTASRSSLVHTPNSTARTHLNAQRSAMDCGSSLFLEPDYDLVTSGSASLKPLSEGLSCDEEFLFPKTMLRPGDYLHSVSMDSACSLDSCSPSQSTCFGEEAWTSAVAQDSCLPAHFRQSKTPSTGLNKDDRPLPNVYSSSRKSYFSATYDRQELMLKQFAARQPTEKGNRACSFFLRGHCKKEDCQFAHDLRNVVCRFWAESECFRGDECPFRHRPLNLEEENPAKCSAEDAVILPSTVQTS